MTCFCLGIISLAWWVLENVALEWLAAPQLGLANPVLSMMAHHGLPVVSSLDSVSLGFPLALIHAITSFGFLFYPFLWVHPCVHKHGPQGSIWGQSVLSCSVGAWDQRQRTTLPSEPSFILFLWGTSSVSKPIGHFFSSSYSSLWLIICIYLYLDRILLVIFCPHWERIGPTRA